MTTPIPLLYINNHKSKSIWFNQCNNREQQFRQISYFTARKPGSNRYLTLLVIDHNTKYSIKNIINLKLVPEHVINDIHANKTRLVILELFEGCVCGPTMPLYSTDYEALNNWCEKHNFTAEQVYYLHENFNQDLMPENARFTLYPFTTFFCWLQQEPLNDLQFIPKDPHYLFLLYNRANRIHRWVLGAQLLDRELLKMGKCSYELFGHSQDAHAMSNWAANDTRLSDLAPSIKILEEISPLMLDYTSLQNNNPVYLLNKDHHETTFMSIVTETLVRGEHFFSEKIWKPVMAGQPFMLLGSPGLLKLFKSWNFQTFDRWFDESYDDIADMRTRSEAIVREVERLSKLSIDQLQAIRKEMLPVLQHNQRRYVELRKRMCEYNDVKVVKDSDITYFWNFQKMPKMVVRKIWYEWVGNCSAVDISDYNNFS